MLLSLKVWNPTYAFTWSIPYLGAQIYGRVQVDPVQSLGSGFSVHIEKVFLCSGRDGYIPKYQPANSEYGCLADAPNLLYRFKVIVSTPTQKRLNSEFTKPNRINRKKAKSKNGCFALLYIRGCDSQLKNAERKTTEKYLGFFRLKTTIDFFPFFGCEFFSFYNRFDFSTKYQIGYFSGSGIPIIEPTQMKTFFFHFLF